MNSVKFLILVLLLSSCESVIDFPDVPEEKAVPVIEAVLTDRMENQKVRVTSTVALKDSLSCLFIENAMVYVFNEIGDTLFYQYQSDGWYQSAPYAAKTNTLYTLSVTTGSTEYQATGSAVEIKGIDTVYSGNENDTTSWLYFKMFKPDEQTRYYYADIFKNNELVNRKTDVFLIYDENIFDTLELQLPYRFRKNDTVTIRFQSLSKEMFDYYFQLIGHFYYTNYFNIGYRSNPPEMFTNKALGYFQVSSVRSDSVIIR